MFQNIFSTEVTQFIINRQQKVLSPVLIRKKHAHLVDCLYVDIQMFEKTRPPGSKTVDLCIDIVLRHTFSLVTVCVVSCQCPAVLSLSSRPVKILVRTGGLGILQFCTVSAQMCSSQTCKGCFTMFKIKSAIFMKPLHPSAHLKLVKMSSKIITNGKASGNQSEKAIVGA